MDEIFRTEVMAYLTAVLLTIGMLFAITAGPADANAVFPAASSQELMQAVQWAWSCVEPQAQLDPSGSCVWPPRLHMSYATGAVVRTR